jgi:hypothetical protein
MSRDDKRISTRQIAEPLKAIERSAYVDDPREWDIALEVLEKVGRVRCQNQPSLSRPYPHDLLPIRVPTYPVKGNTRCNETISVMVADTPRKQLTDSDCYILWIVSAP